MKNHKSEDILKMCVCVRVCACGGGGVNRFVHMSFSQLVWV